MQHHTNEVEHDAQVAESLSQYEEPVQKFMATVIEVIQKGLPFDGYRSTAIVFDLTSDKEVEMKKVDLILDIDHDQQGPLEVKDAMIPTDSSGDALRAIVALVEEKGYFFDPGLVDQIVERLDDLLCIDNVEVDEIIERMRKHFPGAEFKGLNVGLCIYMSQDQVQINLNHSLLWTPGEQSVEVHHLGATANRCTNHFFQLGSIETASFPKEI